MMMFEYPMWLMAYEYSATEPVSKVASEAVMTVSPLMETRCAARCSL